MQTIYLDISNKGVIPCIQAKQSEVGRKFLAVITDNGVPYNIPNESLLSVWYEGDTDAGNYSSIEEKSAFVIDGNKVTVELVAQMLLMPGKGELCLSMTHGDGGETNTWNIPYDVEYKPGAGSAVPTEYYTALTEAGSIAAQSAAEAKKYAEDAAGILDNSLKIQRLETNLAKYQYVKLHITPSDGGIHAIITANFSAKREGGDWIVARSWLVTATSHFGFQISELGNYFVDHSNQEAADTDADQKGLDFAESYVDAVGTMGFTFKNMFPEIATTFVSVVPICGTITHFASSGT